MGLPKPFPQKLCPVSTGAELETQNRRLQVRHSAWTAAPGGGGARTSADPGAQDQGWAESPRPHPALEHLGQTSYTHGDWKQTGSIRTML